MAPLSHPNPSAAPKFRRRRLLRLLAGSGLAMSLLGPGPSLRAQNRLAAGSEPAGQRLRVFAVADSGSGDSAQRAVAVQMAQRHRRSPVELVLLGGDNIYNDGDIALVRSHFEQPYRELLQAGVPFKAVLGNHDVRRDGGAGQLAYRGFGMEGRWYSFRRGPVQFFMLDTNPGDHWTTQLSWLRRQLAASRAPWKVVVGHHPLYSEGFYGDDAGLIARLTPLFKNYGVQLYINGHDHNYARTPAIQGTTYLTVGGGGASLRPVTLRRSGARAVSAHSFAELEFNANDLRLQAWDRNGTRVDDVRLSAALI